jgi:diguanylate cyclase
MPGCDPHTGLALAEKIRRAVEERCSLSSGADGTMHITVSIGVACLGAAHASVSDLIDEADQALYAAKADGRNRVARAGSPPRADDTATRIAHTAV